MLVASSRTTNADSEWRFQRCCEPRRLSVKLRIQSRFDDEQTSNVPCQLTCRDVVLVVGGHVPVGTNVVSGGHVYWRQAELTHDVIDNSGDQSARVVN